MNSNRKYLAVVATLALSVGCEQRELRPLNPCTVNGVSVRVNIANVDKVDLLFMIDNSGSMREEQSSLASEIPRLVETLATGMTRDGSKTFPAVRDLRIGIISSDMGTGGNAVDSCDEPNFGDDGILRRTPGGACAGIPAGMPPYLGFRPAEGGSATAFGTEIACLADLGTTGCGFEQQLDATLKALTPSSSPLTFVNGTRGHGDGANEGFLREDSLLAIIELTDEDDCSASNPDIFNRTSGAFPDQRMNLRCSNYGDPSFGAVHPVQRYIDGLLALRNPELLVFAAIAGIPVELAPGPGEAIDYRAMVGPEPEADGSCADPSGCRHELMVEIPDPTMLPTPSQLRPSCDVLDRGKAYPPIRIVQVAQGLEQAGASSVIQSICQDSYAGALDAIIDKIAESLAATCLPRPLNQDSEGRVTCDVVEVLPLTGDITDCDQIAGKGRVFREFDEATGRQACTVCQTDASGNMIDANPECQALGVSAGWFYESGASLIRCPDSRPQAVSFHGGAEPTTGSLVRLDCLQIAGSGDDLVTIGTGCGGGNAAICGDAAIGGAPTPMVCDSFDNTCQLGCNSTGDCGAAGLGGYVCYDASGDGQSYCVNPTCTTT